jgi:Kef-type K+ transport system membrane component KefB
MVATHATLSNAYLAEDNSTPLLATCIAFLIIEGIFIFLMYASRFLGKDQKANLWMTLLMTGAYVVCIAKITIGIRKSPPILFDWMDASEQL